MPTGLPKVGVHLNLETNTFNTNQTPPLGGVTVKVHYVFFNPYQPGRVRARSNEPANKASYSPPFQLGKPIDNSAILTVIESDNAKFEEGQVLIDPRTWTEEFSALSKEEADIYLVLDNPYALNSKLFLGALGMSGLVAYSSFYEIGRP